MAGFSSGTSWPVPRHRHTPPAPHGHGKGSSPFWSQGCQSGSGMILEGGSLRRFTPSSQGDSPVNTPVFSSTLGSPASIFFFPGRPRFCQGNRTPSPGPEDRPEGSCCSPPKIWPRPIPSASSLVTEPDSPGPFPLLSPGEHETLFGAGGPLLGHPAREKFPSATKRAVSRIEAQIKTRGGLPVCATRIVRFLEPRQSCSRHTLHS